MLKNIEKKLNESSQYNYKYDVSNDDNLDINLKIQLKTDYKTILVQYLNDEYVINTINTNNANYYNKALNGNESLYIGDKYAFNYALLKQQQPTLEFNIYLNVNRTVLYNSKECFNDTKNNIVYITITETTPDILYYGYNNGTQFGQAIYTQTYENIINVKYDTNAYLLQFHYTYDNTNNVNMEIPNFVLGPAINSPNLGFYNWVMQPLNENISKTNTKLTNYNSILIL